MLPDYAEYGDGQGNMCDTVMLFGALGNGRGELITEYLPSSGTGQTNVVFPLTWTAQQPARPVR